MPPPTTEEKVKQASPDGIVILWRGTRPTTAQRIEATKTAGGYDTSATPGLEPSAPSEQHAIVQVSGASHPEFKNFRRIPEFTTSQFWARNYANGAIVCIAIRKKFLTKGSGSEGGWIVYPEAPLEGVLWENFTSQREVKVALGKDGRQLIGD